MGKTKTPVMSNCRKARRRTSVRSFSALGFNTDGIEGAVLYEDPVRMCELVEDKDEAALWIIDTLDEVGVRLDELQLKAMLPILNSWTPRRRTTQ